MSGGRIMAALLIAFVLLACAAIATVVYYGADQKLRESMEFAGAVLGGAGILFGAFYGFLLAANSSAETRRRRSLEIIDQLNKQEILRTRVKLETAVKASADPYEHLTSTDELWADTLFYLGLLEDIALTIRNHVADEEVLYDSLSFMLPESYKIFQPFIEGLRATHGGDETLYCEFEKLSKLWRECRSYRTNRKIGSDM